MYKAADGKAFGNSEQGKHYDKTRKHKQPEHEGGARGTDQAEGGVEEQPIEESIQQHGPVHHLEIHSHHRDGHVHKSTHHDGQSAHEHIDKAMPPQQEHGEQPALDQSMGSAPGIPGMAA